MKGQSAISIEREMSWQQGKLKQERDRERRKGKGWSERERERERKRERERERERFFFDYPMSSQPAIMQVLRIKPFYLLIRFLWIYTCKWSTGL